LKISIVTPFYHPSLGGVETIVRDTAEELGRRNHEVRVITTIYNNFWEEIANSGVDVINKVEIYRLKPNILRIGYATIMNGIEDTVKKTAPNVVHSHCLHPHLFQMIGLKEKLGFKLVVQLHFPVASGIEGMSGRLAFRIALWRLRMKQSNINAFIVHTNLEKEWLISEGFDERIICKLKYPCIGPMPKGTELKCKFQNKPTILYLGRVTERKGVHILLQALPEVIRYVGDVQVIVAGPADKEYSKKLSVLAERLRIIEHVVFKEPLSQEEKYQYMSHATIFVSPSIKDYTPVTLLEAQALGTPVISTRTGAISEIMKDEETGLLVKLGDPEQLAKAINSLLLNPARRERMGIAAGELVQQEFSLHKTITELEKIYCSIL
jgi:glycosyltransferase involved in cell wall biosynthesis